jgi:AraC family transcriptional regulator, regulatory protein of adaptative response / methylated-DNA-[protein]-cysteine methyltransferase
MIMMIHAHARWRDFPMRIAGDGHGIRALLPGGKAETLAELRARFPHAKMEPGTLPAFDAALACLEVGKIMMLPLRPQGTPFQESVWRALMKIPLGKTSTYAALAASIGRPKAARAVAAACAANPIAILIPCHRVIGSDGSLSGYRWGIELKKRLLEWEQCRPTTER